MAEAFFNKNGQQRQQQPQQHQQQHPQQHHQQHPQQHQHPQQPPQLRQHGQSQPYLQQTHPQYSSPTSQRPPAGFGGFSPNNVGQPMTRMHASHPQLATGQAQPSVRTPPRRVMPPTNIRVSPNGRPTPGNSHSVTGARPSLTLSAPQGGGGSGAAAPQSGPNLMLGLPRKASAAPTHSTVAASQLGVPPAAVGPGRSPGPQLSLIPAQQPVSVPSAGHGGSSVASSAAAPKFQTKYTLSTGQSIALANAFVPFEPGLRSLKTFIYKLEQRAIASGNDKILVYLEKALINLLKAKMSIPDFVVTLRKIFQASAPDDLVEKLQTQMSSFWAYRKAIQQKLLAKKSALAQGASSSGPNLTLPSSTRPSSTDPNRLASVVPDFNLDDASVLTAANTGPSLTLPPASNESKQSSSMDLLAAVADAGSNVKSEDRDANQASGALSPSSASQPAEKEKPNKPKQPQQPKKSNGGKNNGSKDGSGSSSKSKSSKAPDSKSQSNAASRKKGGGKPSKSTKGSQDKKGGNSKSTSKASSKDSKVTKKDPSKGATKDSKAPSKAKPKSAAASSKSSSSAAPNIDSTKPKDSSNSQSTSQKPKSAASQSSTSQTTHGGKAPQTDGKASSPSSAQVPSNVTTKQAQPVVPNQRCLKMPQTPPVPNGVADSYIKGLMFVNPRGLIEKTFPKAVAALMDDLPGRTSPPTIDDAFYHAVSNGAQMYMKRVLQQASVFAQQRLDRDTPKHPLAKRFNNPRGQLDIVKRLDMAASRANAPSLTTKAAPKRNEPEGSVIAVLDMLTKKSRKRPAEDTTLQSSKRHKTKSVVAPRISLRDVLFALEDDAPQARAPHVLEAFGLQLDPNYRRT